MPRQEPEYDIPPWTCTESLRLDLKLQVAVVLSPAHGRTLRRRMSFLKQFPVFYDVQKIRNGSAAHEEQTASIACWMSLLIISALPASPDGKGSFPGTHLSSLSQARYIRFARSFTEILIHVPTHHDPAYLGGYVKSTNTSKFEICKGAIDSECR